MPEVVQVVLREIQCLVSVGGRRNQGLNLRRDWIESACRNGVAGERVSAYLAVLKRRACSRIVYRAVENRAPGVWVAADLVADENLV